MCFILIATRVSRKYETLLKGKKIMRLTHFVISYSCTCRFGFVMLSWENKILTCVEHNLGCEFG